MTKFECIMGSYEFEKCDEFLYRYEDDDIVVEVIRVGKKYVVRIEKNLRGYIKVDVQILAKLDDLTKCLNDAFGY